MNTIYEESLPFKVKTRAQPQIIYNSDAPLPFGKGTEAVSREGKIHVFTKSLPKWKIEHEIAHFQLGHTGKTKMIAEYIERELQADLIAYCRTGHPKRLNTEITIWVQQSAESIIGAHPTTTKSMLVGSIHFHIKNVLSKYWKYLPEAWKEDAKKFYKEYEQGHVQALEDELTRTPLPSAKKTKSKAAIKNKKRAKKRKPQDSFGIVTSKWL